MKILKIIFEVLGVIFFLIILAAIYIWIADPFNLKPLMSAGLSPTAVIKTVTGNSEVKVDNVDKNPLISEEQEAQLESLGIDPAKLPSEITPQMEKCFAEELGSARAAEIAEGSSPTPTDFFKASACFK